MTSLFYMMGVCVAAQMCLRPLLGASAVLVGRPCIYGLATAGALGVAHVLKILKEEFEITMALMGTATLADIQPDMVIEFS